MTRRGSGRLGGVPGPLVSHVDQLLLLTRSAGQDAIIQGLWRFDHPLEPATVQAVHDALGRGTFARLMERSAVPFGRPRWVAAPWPPGPDVAPEPRSPDDLWDWADAQVDLPLDPERGPGWRMGVLPLTDGTTVVSVTVSHCIVDGLGFRDALVRAGSGEAFPALPLPTPGEHRAATFRADLRQTLRDVPAVARALGHAGRSFRPRRPSGRSSVGGADRGDDLVRMSTVVAMVPSDAWNARATALGGTDRSLLVAVGARLGDRLGRARRGVATLLVPVSDFDDDREVTANPVALARLGIAVTEAHDLPRVRSATGEAIARVRTEPDDRVLLPLVPFVPRRAVTAVSEGVLGLADDRPVNVSFMGEIPEGVLRIAGTPARWFWPRGVDRKVTSGSLARRGGVLTLIAGTLDGSLVVSVTSYQPDLVNTRDALRAVVAETLAEYGVQAEIR